jgi:hypothetical protein
VPEGGVDLRARAWFNPGLESRVYNVPAIIGVLLLLMCLLLTALTVVRERELGTLEQLMVSPLTPGELMLGKTIPVAIIALIDLASSAWSPSSGSRAAPRQRVRAAARVVPLHPRQPRARPVHLDRVATQQEAFMGMFLLMLPPSSCPASCIPCTRCRRSSST